MCSCHLRGTDSSKLMLADDVSDNEGGENNVVTAMMQV